MWERYQLRWQARLFLADITVIHGLMKRAYSSIIFLFLFEDNLFKFVIYCTL